MTAIFGPAANLGVKVVLLILASAFAALLLFWLVWPRLDYARHLKTVLPQPVPFSHQHHVSGLGIDCRFCHSAVEVSADAGLPATHTCMTCHSQIWTNAALLAPVRESFAQEKPISWRQVTDLPDYVYFDHSIHIAKGVGCASCHGDMANMALTYKAKSLTMQFCLDCHRDPGPNLRPRSEILNTEWHRDSQTPSASTFLSLYHVPDRNLTDCSLCHR